MNTFSVGDGVRLTGSPKNLLMYRGRDGVITAIALAKSCQFATVELTAQEPGNLPMTLRDVPTGYLSPTPPAKPVRRGVLNMNATPDTRTEKQKSADGKAWLQSLGYEVLEVGTERHPARCYQCVKGGKRGAALCPTHGVPVYSMDTGSTPGVADWIIRHPARWAMWSVLCVEWKRNEKAPRRTEQVRLNAAGWYPIVASISELAEAVHRFEAQYLGIAFEPELMTKFRAGGSSGGREL